MRKIIYILFITNLVYAQNITLDSNTILIGEQINLHISNTVENTEIWPNYKEFLTEDIEVIETSKIDTNNGIISQSFTLTAWDSGSYYIPPIKFSEENKTEGILLNVQSIELEENAKLKDIKKPFNEPIGWSDIWPFLFVILIILLAIYVLKKYVFKKEKKKEKRKPIVIIRPDITALEQLNKLEHAEIWQKGDIKNYYSQLSEIIRRYCENRFQFIALEITTDEILIELAEEINTKEITKLKILLERADLAKFAKSKPAKNENIQSMLLAKEFVNNTKGE
tara:strand:- start:884 stop:1726 length:843 start_codon:yes stop_codon:yes gene_type:complete